LAPSWLGRHQIRVEDDQPFEVKHQRMQEGRELILCHSAVAHPLGALGKDPFIGRAQMRIPPIAIPILGLHIIPDSAVDVH
jgi:hypothetical protein